MVVEMVVDMVVVVVVVMMVVLVLIVMLVAVKSGGGGGCPLVELTVERPRAGRSTEGWWEGGRFYGD